MKHYLHRVVGLYPSYAAASSARDQVIAQAIAPDRIRILGPGTPAGGQDAAADSDDVLKDLLRDGAIGTAVGTAVGAAGTIALAAAQVTLFIASPVLGALYLLGWGASLGGLVGAMVGSERSKGDVSTLIKDALAGDQFVLVVQAADEAQTSLARQVVGDSMAEALLPAGAAPA